MKNSQIHPSAIVESGAVLGEGVTVGPYAVIEDGAKIGQGCRVLSHAIIKKHAVIADNVELGHFSVIGGDPQHMGFDRSIHSSVFIGNSTRIGEGVTVHRSIEKDGRTLVGENCFLMGYCHIAHDCEVDNKVVLANGALLGGHVSVGQESFVGGGAAVHQFVRIGKGSMIGGLAEISLDVPPQVLVSGRNAISGLNLIGLKRREVSRSEISELKQCFRKVFTNYNVKRNAEEILRSGECPSSKIAHEFLSFFASGQRGFAKYSLKDGDSLR